MTYFAFLRGINVTGYKIIKMAELKAIFEQIGFKNVRTYIQSGNVVFEAKETGPGMLVKNIEKGLLKSLGYEVIVVIRTLEQVERIIKSYPFTNVKDHDKCKIHVAFLSDVPGKNEIKELLSLNNNEEIFYHSGENVYILLRGGMANSLTGKNIIEKKLKIRATIRNWNTVNKILTV